MQPAFVLVHSPLVGPPTWRPVAERLGVRRLDGDRSCQGNPVTPCTVELSEPLAGREVVDASIVPARQVTLADAG